MENGRWKMDMKIDQFRVYYFILIHFPSSIFYFQSSIFHLHFLLWPIIQNSLVLVLRLQAQTFNHLRHLHKTDLVRGDLGR